MGRALLSEQAETANIPDELGVDILDNSVGFYLGRAHDALLQSIGGRLAEVGLQPHRIAVMTLISANPGITPRALTRLTGRDKSTLTPILADLERKDLVTRVRSKTDRRSYGLTLTAAGESVVVVLKKVVREHERLVAKIIGSEERLKLLEQLKLLTHRLSSKPSA